MKKHSVQLLVFTALLTALIVIATMFVRIPLPLGYVNLGDAFIFLAIFLLGPLYGTIATGVGSTLADLFGYPLYAPGTLIIKSLMAFVACLIYRCLHTATKKTLLAEIIGGVVGTLIMAFGYFIYEILFFETVGVAIVNVPWNVLQGVVGVIVAVLLMRVLRHTKFIDKLRNE
ncbi:MAG: ECF transporter S component [Clostridia bacterium]|nr:ECF transporter S component [Clostridia bacterium]